MNYTISRKKFNTTDILWLLLFSAVLALSFWKVRYGYVIDDEAFYATIPNRLSFGDIFFRDEWHLSQLSGFLTMPFVVLFHAVRGTNDGLLLYLRYCYLVCHTIVSAVIYLKLRGLSRTASEGGSAEKCIGCVLFVCTSVCAEAENNSKRLLQLFAAFASIFFCLFVPGNIMALSYNTMGVDLMALTGVFLACGILKRTRTDFVLSGLFFAGAVLCCPYLLGVYVFFIIALATARFLAQRHALPVSGITAGNRGIIPAFTAGAAVLAAAFLIFYFSRAGIRDITENLPFMLMDPEHQNTSLFYKLPRYFTAVFLHGVVSWKFVFPVFVLELIVMAFDKNRRSHGVLYFAASCILAAVCLMLAIPTLMSTDFTSSVFPLLFPSIVSYILTKEKPEALMFGIFLPGILYSVCLHLSSNQAFFVISMAMIVADLAGILFIGIWLDELQNDSSFSAAKRRICVIAAAVCFLITTGSVGTVRICHTFRDFSPAQLDTTLKQGPAKGVITTQENAFLYQKAYNDLEYYSDKPAGNILILVKEPWYYLETYGKGCSSYSAWIAEEDEHTLHMLDLYYTQNPEKTPDYIYLSKYSGWNLSEVLAGAKKNGYDISEENDLSWKLEREE